MSGLPHAAPRPGNVGADNSNWEIATVSPPDQRWKYYDALDERAAWFYEAVTNDPAMQSHTPGQGQIYLGAYRDADGDWLDGAKFTFCTCLRMRRRCVLVCDGL
jgi:hypothetical protein